MSKIRKINPEGRTYKRLERELREAYSITLYPCGRCGRPTIEGYCCQFCGSTNPRSHNGE